MEPTQHRCYNMTRQDMLLEISRLDAEILSQKKYHAKYHKCKKKGEKLEKQLHTLNVMVSKMLSDI